MSDYFTYLLFYFTSLTEASFIATVTRRGAHGLLPICYLTASTTYNSGAFIPEYDGLSQFKEDTGRPSVPVREINLVACLPLVQPCENPRPDLDLNPGGCRSSASQGPARTVAEKAH